MPATYEEALKEGVETPTQQVERMMRGITRTNGVVAAPARLIAVCTPTLGMVSAWWHASVLDLIWPMNTAKGAPMVPDRKGGEIAETRNRIVSMMLATESDKAKLEGIFWLDDDVIIRSPRTCLLKLVSHNRDIASGVYFTKGEVNEPLIFGGPCAGSIPFEPGKEFEAWGWAQGLSYVRGEVYKRMRDEMELGLDKYGAPLWYEPSEFRVDKQTGDVCVNGTEDFPFFKKANDLGYRCLVDCTEHCFGFHYDANGKDADGWPGVGYPRQQWEQFKRHEPIVWPAKDGREDVVWK